MSKKVSFANEAMEKMLVGLDRAANAVGGTIGPKGKNVYIMDSLTPEITNDGVTIANKIYLKDQEEDAGAYVIRNVSAQQNDDVGDGTTTVTVLTQAIIHECLKRPENSMEVKESLKEAGDKVLKSLSKKSKSITKSDIERVALISAENKELAGIITEIVNKLGAKAVINVEDSKTFATEYEIVDGYEAPVGFVSHHFVNDKKSGKAVFTDVPVLVTEKKISNIQDIQPIFDQFANAKITSCVIACDDIDDSMLGMLVANKALGRFNALVLKTNAETLRDIEGATGAKSVSSNNGITFQNLKLEHLGSAKKVVSDAHKTLFLGANESAKEYANTLEQLVESEPNSYIQKKIKDRVARLRGGVAVLRIGAATDFERNFLKRKAEDAVKAVLAAMEEGVVEGGGLTLWRIAQEMKPKTIGEEILKKAMTYPLRRIAENAGKEYNEVVSGITDSLGYDCKRDVFVNMWDEGLLDPAKVERLALENAVSAASTVITTFCLITEDENKDSK